MVLLIVRRSSGPPHDPVRRTYARMTTEGDRHSPWTPAFRGRPLSWLSGEQSLVQECSSPIFLC